MVLLVQKKRILDFECGKGTFKGQLAHFICLFTLTKGEKIVYGGEDEFDEIRVATTSDIT